MKKQTGKPQQLSDLTLRRLNGYALAAGAAGVGVLAAAASAHAEVVFTPANITISQFHNSLYSLNPAGAAVAPFLLAANFTSPGNAGYWDTLSFNPQTSGAAFVTVAGATSSVTPLGKGAEIGPAQDFAAGNRGFIATYGPYGGGTYNNHDGIKFNQSVYVGFKFAISGQPHYGWARVEVRYSPNFHKHKLSLRLLGYAYETTANQPIKAGQTTGALKNSGVERLPVSTPHTITRLDSLGSRGPRNLAQTINRPGCPRFRQGAQVSAVLRDLGSTPTLSRNLFVLFFRARLFAVFLLFLFVLKILFKPLRPANRG